MRLAHRLPFVAFLVLVGGSAWASPPAGEMQQSVMSVGAVVLDCRTSAVAAGRRSPATTTVCSTETDPEIVVGDHVDLTARRAPAPTPTPPSSSAPTRVETTDAQGGTIIVTYVY